MSGSPKRHHWWPQCHSTLWVDGEGCVTTITSSGEIRRTQPVNIAVRGHYYSVRMPGGSRDATLETFFADTIEGPAAPILARLAAETRRDYQLETRYNKQALRRDWKSIKGDGFVPDTRAFSAAFSEADRQALARYVASMIVRVPSYKDKLNSNRMLENVAALLCRSTDDARFATDKLHIEILRRHLEDYAARLAECAFILIDTPEGLEFIIGDTPIIPAALGFGEAEAICPITPNRALLIIRGWRAPFADRIAIFRSQPKSVRAFNTTMLQNAEREIFCRTVLPLGYVAKHIGTRQARLISSINTASDDRIGRGPMLTRYQNHG